VKKNAVSAEARGGDNPVTASGGMRMQTRKRDRLEREFESVRNMACSSNAYFAEKCTECGLDPVKTSIGTLHIHMLLRMAWDGKTEAIRQVTDRMFGKTADKLNITSDIENVILQWGIAIDGGHSSVAEAHEVKAELVE